MKKTNMFSLLVVALVSFGCTITDSGSIITGATRAPTNADQVRLYRAAPDNYEEIAIVSASAVHDFRKDSELMESAMQQLKEEAAKLGANGILLTTINERDAPSTTTGYSSASARASDGSSAYGTGNTISVNRGDAYTRVQGLAIYVSE